MASEGSDISIESKLTTGADRHQKHESQPGSGLAHDRAEPKEPSPARQIPFFSTYMQYKSSKELSDKKTDPPMLNLGVNHESLQST
uniref:Uncharacterized protein n=1 Tax=Romanomermis culicivorax TaxID=13658 RepID=A0A915KP33_ROMCU